MKLLYITSLSGKRINGFMRSAILAAKKANIEFVMVSNMNGADKKLYQQDAEEYGIKVRHADIQRSPYQPKNLLAYEQICKLIKEEDIDIIHCNTPIGGVLGRLCGVKTKIKFIIYQAHGFHFCKDAPKKNWLLYYPIEKYLSNFTDLLITINAEDYNLARNKFRAKDTIYIPGVGIDLTKFSNKVNPKNILRNELYIKDNDILLISVGELNSNKNHEIVIRALSQINDANIKYIIVGNGPLRRNLEQLVLELNLEYKVKFLGFRSDINELYNASDICVFPSFREGLSVALMEAMACSIPVICSDIRGNRDLIDENGGILFNPKDVNSLIKAIQNIKSKALKQLGAYNKQKVENFSLEKIVIRMEKMYMDVKSQMINH